MANFQKHAQEASDTTIMALRLGGVKKGAKAIAWHKVRPSIFISFTRRPRNDLSLIALASAQHA